MKPIRYLSRNPMKLTTPCNWEMHLATNNTDPDRHIKRRFYEIFSTGDLEYPKFSVN